MKTVQFLLRWILAAAPLALACGTSTSDAVQGDDSEAGIVAGSGGTSGDGGAAGKATGGSGGKTGGSTGAGGATGTGGKTGAGGTTGSGGATGAGGTTGTGGATGAGGTLTDGGTSGVRVVGRYDDSDANGPKFDWSGVSVLGRFTGTSVSVNLDSNGSEYAVFVDGVEKTKIVTSGNKTYPIATGLAAGTHDVMIWRRSEAMFGVTQFLGFKLDATGSLLAPPAALGRRIEVVGDSYTCGYGNEGTLGCTFNASTENDYLAYASVAARAVNAELSTVAWSGRGMWRNYGATTASPDAMPTLYDFAVTATQTPWTFSKFVPDVVVIYLGINDSSTHGDPGQPYVDAYVAFVKHVRSKYANAWILCIDPGLATDIASVLSTVKTGGDNKIDSVNIDSSAGGVGCDYHPNTVKDADMGQKLATKLKQMMGW
jgi:lysophospholipase L1-like esterase